MNTDHNECNSNAHACEHVCHNSQGSYACSCNTGYRLAANNRTCDGKKVTFLYFIITHY